MWVLSLSWWRKYWKLGMNVLNIPSFTDDTSRWWTFSHRTGWGCFAVSKTLQEISGESVGYWRHSLCIPEHRQLTFSQAVSTGRWRRCGWLDLVVLRYSAAVNREKLAGVLLPFPGKTTDARTGRLSSINLTKRGYLGLRLWHAPEADSKSLIDVLDTFPTIRLAVAYVTWRRKAHELPGRPEPCPWLFLTSYGPLLSSYLSSTNARSNTSTFKAGKALLRGHGNGLISRRKRGSISSLPSHRSVPRCIAEGRSQLFCMPAKYNRLSTLELAKIARTWSSGSDIAGPLWASLFEQHRIRFWFSGLLARRSIQ